MSRFDESVVREAREWADEVTHPSLREVLLHLANRVEALVPKQTPRREVAASDAPGRPN